MAEQRERRARKRREAARAAPGGHGDHEPQLTRTQKLTLKKKARKIKVSEVIKIHNSKAILLK